MTGDDRKLIDDIAAVHLVSIINHIAESFDVAALSPAEAVAAYTLMDRLTSALWQEHKTVLVPLYRALLTRLGIEDDPDEPDDGEPH